MKLTATFGNLTGNVGCDQQRRFVVGLALGFDQRGGFEPVYCFDFGAEAVVTLVRGQFEDGIGGVILTDWDRMDLGSKTCGSLEGLPGGV